jgi:hypothetical protein
MDALNRRVTKIIYLNFKNRPSRLKRLTKNVPQNVNFHLTVYGCAYNGLRGSIFTEGMQRKREPNFKNQRRFLEVFYLIDAFLAVGSGLR